METGCFTDGKNLIIVIDTREFVNLTRRIKNCDCTKKIFEWLLRTLSSWSISYLLKNNKQCENYGFVGSETKKCWEQLSHSSRYKIMRCNNPREWDNLAQHSWILQLYFTIRYRISVAFKFLTY